MLQKTKSMLLKVLICLCLVCCLVAVLVTAAACNKSDPTVVGGSIDSNGHLILEMSDGTTKDAGLVAGANGSDGKDGNSGTDGKDGLWITKVEFDADGNLLITLSDNSQLTVEVADYPDKCPGSKDGHLWGEHKVVDANCKTGDIYLVVCRNDGCNAMYLDERGSINADNHINTSETKQPATCTEDGFDKVVCQDCGKTLKNETIAKLGHSSRDPKDPVDPAKILLVANNPDENVCEDGGQRLIVCGHCLVEVFEAEVIEPLGHQVTSSWVWETEPTAESTGVLAGSCAQCGNGHATVEAPKLSEKDYTLNKKSEPTCDEQSTAKQGEYEWTLKKYSDVPAVVTHPLTTHLFKNKEYSGARDSGLVYDDVTGPDGFTHYDNAPATCLDEPGLASFECERCHNNIIINIRGNHVRGEKIESECVAPTCDKAGKDVYACKNDPTHRDEVTVPALGHNYEYKPVDISADPIVVEGTCSRCGAKDTFEVKAGTWAKVEAKSTPEAQRKCGVDIVDVYEFVLKDDATNTKHEVTVHSTIKHHIADFTFKTEPSASTTYQVGEFSAAAIEKFEEFDNALATCEDEGYVGFVCDGCSKHFIIKVTGNHQWVKQTGATDHKDATCTDPAKDLYKCSVCGTTEWKNVQGSKALGHKWAVDLKVNANGTWTLTKTCERECGVAPVVVENVQKDTSFGNGTGITETPATCEKEGSRTYHYIEDGKKGSVDATIPKLTTHKYSESLSVDLTKKDYRISDFPKGTVFDNTPANCTTPGLFGFTCLDCGKKFVIEVYGDHAWEKDATGADKTTVVPATCTKDGGTYKHCTAENKDILVPGTTTKATGHNFKYELTKPTLESAGKLVITCTRCSEFSKEIALPALNATDYKKTEVTKATCKVEGVDRYTKTIEDKTVGYSYNVSIDVTTPVLSHSAEGTEITWDVGGYRYHGYICKNCGEVIKVGEPEKLPVEVLTEAKEGKFVLVMEPAPALEGWYYATGELANQYYLASSTDSAKAVEFEITKSGDGYTITVGGKFVEVVISGEHVNVQIVEKQTAGSVWKWNDEHKVFTMTLGGKEYYLGTYTNSSGKTFDTFSASEIKYIENSTSWAAKFATLTEAE